jgi:hypothetical protein
MESAQQINRKINAIFDKFLEDRDIYNKNSFLEKLISFGNSNNLKRSIKDINAWSWILVYVFIFLFIIIMNKSKMTQKNILISISDGDQMMWLLGLIFIILIIGIFLLLFLSLFLTMIVTQKSSKENMEDIKQQYLQEIDSCFKDNDLTNSKSDNPLEFNRSNDNGDIDNFIIGTLMSYFQFLIRNTDKRRDSLDYFIPFLTWITILISIFVIGLPLIPGLERLPSYYALPTFPVLLSAFYKLAFALPSNNLSSKYSKCLLKIENLNSVRNTYQLTIEEALKRIS